MDILQAARKLRPGTSWNCIDGVLSQAIDDSPRVEVPTKEELDTVISLEEYKEKRAAEYPPISDQLDALWKGGTDAETMKAQIQAIKDKYPKP